MKIVKAGTQIFEIPEPTDRFGVLKYLERIGRVCYKSEEKISDESCIKFIQNIRNRKHWAMLEHYIFTISVTEEIYNDITDRSWLNAGNPDFIQAIRFINRTYWPSAPSEDMKYLVSGSATAFNYLWQCKCFHGIAAAGIPIICQFLKDIIPEVMMDPYGYDIRSLNNDIRLLSRDEVTNLPANLRKVHDFASVMFTVDRGVSHELVRHRPCSWAMESTRYCNYSSGKFDNEITVVDPFFFDSDDKLYEHNTWEDACLESEGAYMDLIDNGSKPQEARSILPHSVKTDIVMTAILGEWEHFFNMRVPETAHPQMREVSVPLLSNMDIFTGGMFSEQYKMLLGHSEKLEV